MRESNLLDDMPQPEYRLVGTRTIENRLTAMYRGREFFDGERDCGYGGLRNDGRWRPVAQRMAKHFRLAPNSKVLQLNCEKGYLLWEFKQMGYSFYGVEPSSYARRHADEDVQPCIKSKHDSSSGYDLVIALGVVYTLSLPDAINCLKQIENTGFSAFITLGAYETAEDLHLFRQWSLLGTTILKPDEWRQVMRHAGYTGDYSFVTAQTLRLRAA